MKFIIIFLTLFLWAGIADAFDGIDYYSTNLSSTDCYSSKGTRLKGIRNILQQDRANYHKFHKRDSGDHSDGYFTSYNRRLKFQSANIRVNPTLRSTIERCGAVIVTVWVFPNYIEVTSGAAPNL